MDAIKGRTKGIIMGCQRMWEPINAKIGMKLLRAQWKRFLARNLLMHAIRLVCLIKLIAGVVELGRELPSEWESTVHTPNLLGGSFLCMLAMR